MNAKELDEIAEHAVQQFRDILDGERLAVRTILKTWKRGCFKRYHEDRGATHEVNVAVIDVIRALEAAFKAIGVKF